MRPWCLSSLNLIVIPWNKGQTCLRTSRGSERLSSLSRPGVQSGRDGASVILINFLFSYYFTWYTCSLKFNSFYQPDTMCEPGERCGKTCIKIIVGTSESIWNGLVRCYFRIISYFKCAHVVVIWEKVPIRRKCMPKSIFGVKYGHIATLISNDSAKKKTKLMWWNVDNWSMCRFEIFQSKMKK